MQLCTLTALSVGASPRGIVSSGTAGPVPSDAHVHAGRTQFNICNSQLTTLAIKLSALCWPSPALHAWSYVAGCRLQLACCMQAERNSLASNGFVGPRRRVLAARHTRLGMADRAAQPHVGRARSAARWRAAAPARAHRGRGAGVCDATHAIVRDPRRIVSYGAWLPHRPRAIVVRLAPPCRVVRFVPCRQVVLRVSGPTPGRYLRAPWVLRGSLVSTVLAAMPWVRRLCCTACSMRPPHSLAVRHPRVALSDQYSTMTRHATCNTHQSSV